MIEMDIKEMNYNVLTSEMYTVSKCDNNPDFLFVFGDNTKRVGNGGQAIIRNCSNSIGIATKESIAEFFSDKHYSMNQIVIDRDIMMVKKRIIDYGFKAVVFPKSGLGWGRADMQIECPKTALYLSQRLLEEFGFNNLQDLINSKRF